MNEFELKLSLDDILTILGDFSYLEKLAGLDDDESRIRDYLRNIIING